MFSEKPLLERTLPFFATLLFWAVFLLPSASAAAERGVSAFTGVPSAISALKSDKPKDRLAAINYLGSQQTQEAYEALASSFQTEKVAYLRVQIVEALNVDRSTWAYLCAINAADDPSPAVKMAAASALAAKSEKPDADKRLRILVSDPSEAVRLSAINSLSNAGSGSSVSIIGDAVSDKKESLKTRRFAAGALSRMRTRASDVELFKHTSDGDSEIKAIAIARSTSAATMKPENSAKPVLNKVGRGAVKK